MLNNIIRTIIRLLTPVNDFSEDIATAQKTLAFIADPDNMDTSEVDAYEAGWEVHHTMVEHLGNTDTKPIDNYTFVGW